MTLPTARELRDALKIDKHNLDSELSKNPETFASAGEQCTLANSERDTAKEALKQIDAELYFVHKARLEDEGEKSTETAIKNAIEIDKKHIEATTEWLQAKQRAERFEVLKESFSMRSYAIKDLAGLWVANYFTSDSVKGGKSDEYRYQRNLERHSEARRRRVREDD